MTRFVLVRDIVFELAKHTLPAWAKLIVHGAVLGGQIDLYSARGFVRAYVPLHAFEGHKPNNLPRLKREEELRSFIERYDLKPDDAEEGYVTAWQERWDGDPRRISIGWLFWHDALDWALPIVEHEYLLMDGNADAFSFDDLFPDGEPETAPYYDARFEGLCVLLADAEKLVPMANLESFAFYGSGSDAFLKLGRPKGTGYAAADMPFVEKIREDLSNDPKLSVREAASRYADSAMGGGTRESKIKRLERRLREY